MPALTYDSLFENVQRYIERGNPEDEQVFEQIPWMIMMAERDIAQKLKILGFIEVVTNTFAAGTSVYAKPDRWRQTVSINFGLDIGTVLVPNVQRTPIFPRSYEYCRYLWPNPLLTEVPRFYADYNYQNWLISPTPADDYPFEVVYYQQPPFLSDVNQTNWLTDYAPLALMFGALVQAEPFLKNDERVPLWKDYFTDQLGTLDGQDLQRIIDRSTSRQED